MFPGRLEIHPQRLPHEISTVHVYVVYAGICVSVGSQITKFIVVNCMYAQHLFRPTQAILIEQNEFTRCFRMLSSHSVTVNNHLSIHVTVSQASREYFLFARIHSSQFMFFSLPL